MSNYIFIVFSHSRFASNENKRLNEVFVFSLVKLSDDCTAGSIQVKSLILLRKLMPTCHLPVLLFLAQCRSVEYSISIISLYLSIFSVCPYLSRYLSSQSLPIYLAIYLLSLFLSMYLSYQSVTI